MDEPLSNNRFRRLLLRIGEKAVDAIIGAVVVAALGGVIWAVTLIGPKVVDWLSGTETIDRWLLVLIVIAAFVAAPLTLLTIAALKHWRLVEIEVLAVEAVPARLDLSGVGPTSAEILVRVQDQRGRPASKSKIDLYTPKGEFLNNFRAISVWTDRDGIARTRFRTSTGTTPGDVLITILVHRQAKPALIETVAINVVGPPAFITLTGAPDRIIVGESVTLTAKLTDAIGQNVWDDSKVDLVTNAGRFSQNPIETRNGVGIAFLLTEKTGFGTVVATAQTGITCQVRIQAYPEAQT